MYPIKGKYSTATIMTDETSIDSDVYKQILGFTNCHVFTNDSKIMPDYHYGAGATIGFTMPMTDKIIPNIVGSDIGCQMLFVSFQKFLDFDKKQWLAVDRQVRKHIPMSDKYRSKPALDIQKDFPWLIATLEMEVFTTHLNDRLGTKYKGEEYTSDWFFKLCERVRCKPIRAVNSIGTLGGGK